LYQRVLKNNEIRITDNYYYHENNKKLIKIMIQQNIESELSYAYLHAIAGKAGMSCSIGTRHDDGEGVDAIVNYRGKLDHSYLTHIQLNIQLKATIKKPIINENNTFSYFFQGIKRYDKLRTEDSQIYKLLVVLFLPENQDEWLKCTPDELVLKNAAYWVNLYGAPQTTNDTGITIQIPKEHLLTPDGLIKLVNLAANKKVPQYQIEH